MMVLLQNGLVKRVQKWFNKIAFSFFVNQEVPPLLRGHFLLFANVLCPQECQKSATRQSIAMLAVCCF